MKPTRQQPEAELAVAVAAHRVPDLADHVEDRAARDGVEESSSGSEVTL